MELNIILTLWAILLVVAHPVTCQPQTSTTVQIRNGTVHGVFDPNSRVHKWLGIPYAQQPVGNLRLRQAVPLNTSLGNLNATEFGPSCYGRGNPSPSEACLSLNIWRPATNSSGSGLLPVLVWLYGGGLQGGYTADPKFEGINLTKISREIGKPVIFVSLNYRLGSLGFLNGKQMAELGLLNIGMLDQRLAMHWIQENIAAFGGDPSKVTLAGESAGAVSIYSHMMAYGGRDDHLFRGAILESGGAFPLTGPDTKAFQATFDSLITDTKCSSLTNSSAADQLDCIRSLPIDVLLRSVGPSTGQSIDGSFTTTSVQFAFPAGDYVKVATIVGTNTDEGTTSAPTGIDTTEELRGPLAAGYFRPIALPNSTVEHLLKIYPSDPRAGCPYNTGSAINTAGKLDKQACSIFGDIVQHGPARMIARSLSKNNGNAVYRYRFNALPHSAVAFGKGITTGLEMNYVFSNLVADYPWDKALAYEMTSAWISFAHDLNPNRGEDSTLPYWSVYGSNSTSIVFSTFGSTLESDNYRSDGIQYIIDNVLPYGAA